MDFTFSQKIRPRISFLLAIPISIEHLPYSSPICMNMKKNQYLLASRALLLAVLCTLSACAPYMLQYKSAQDSFNQAAEIENQSLTDPQSMMIADFSLPYAMMTDLIGSKDQQLKQDGLLGNAYVIQALAAWKTGKYTEAQRASEEALLALAPNMHRDRALMEAMPGLIAAEKAYAITNEQGSNFCDIADLVKTAYENLGKAAEKAPQKHPVKAYLHTNQLAALATLSQAAEKLTGDESGCGFACMGQGVIGRRKLSSCITEKANLAIAQLGELEGQQANIEFWNNRLGLD